MNDTRPTLYHLSYCPYCVRVRAVAEDLGVPLNLVEIREEPTAKAYLLQTLGRATVPVLGISDVTAAGEERLLPESDEIIAYLREHAAELKEVA